MRGRAAPPHPRIYRVPPLAPQGVKAHSVLTKCDVNVWLDIGHLFYAFFLWMEKSHKRKKKPISHIDLTLVQ